MSEKIIKILRYLIIIPFYYITRNNSIYLYLLSISIYNIFSSLFSNVSIYKYIKDIYYIHVKNKIIINSIKTIGIINLIFIVISIILSDITSLIFKIDNTFLIFLIMPLTISIDTLVKLLMEYLESFKYKKLSNKLYILYNYLDVIIFLVIALLSFKVYKLPNYISIMLLYLSKIVSFIFIGIIAYFKIKKIGIKDNLNDDNTYQYKKINRDVFKINNETLTLIFRNSYFYISIMLLYLILNRRYNYNIKYIHENIVFTYYYSLNIILCIMYLIVDYINDKKYDMEKYLYNIFKYMVSMMIIVSILSYPIMNLLFLHGEYMSYLLWISIMGLFMAIYYYSYNYIKNKKVLYISLISGLIIKIVLLIPIIDSVYRMGYNLIYGDIISTILGMIISIIINYIYIRNIYKLNNSIYLEKIFNVIYNNILLLLILVLLDFIIPIHSKNIFISFFVIILYLLITYIYFRIKSGVKNNG